MYAGDEASNELFPIHATSETARARRRVTPAKGQNGLLACTRARSLTLLAQGLRLGAVGARPAFAKHVRTLNTHKTEKAGDPPDPSTNGPEMRVTRSFPGVLRGVLRVTRSFPSSETAHERVSRAFPESAV